MDPLVHVQGHSVLFFVFRYTLQSCYQYQLLFSSVDIVRFCVANVASFGCELGLTYYGIYSKDHKGRHSSVLVK